MQILWTAGPLWHALAGAGAAFRGFAHTAAPLAVTALWQGAILACGLALCLRLAPRASAAHRFAVWSAGFAALMALPILPLLLPARAAASAGPAEITSAAAHPWLELDARWSLAIGGLWIVLSVVRAADLGIHSIRLRRLWKAAAPVAPEVLAQALPAGHVRLPGRRSLQICTTNALDRPSVIGFLAPRILIPAWLFARLTPGELEQVILHEAEHLRRGDDWTNLLQKLCLVLFPLNPALLWIERRLCREREMACDDGVVQVTQAPRAYAACLTSLAERSRERVLERRAEALSLGAWRQRPELVDRVHRLLRRTPGLSPLATRVLLAGMSGALVLGSVEFARCPQLIAFVPAPSMAAAAPHAGAPVPADSGETDALLRTDVVPAGFHAIQAVAHLPEHATGKPVRHAAARHYVARPAAPAAADRDLPQVASNEAPAASLPMKASTARPAPGINASQQWVFFTAWEQVETVEPAPASDETVVAAHKVSRAGIQPAAGTTTSRVAVTQLILRVYPTGVLTTSTSGSVSGQMAAVPVRNGWLIFQL